MEHQRAVVSRQQFSDTAIATLVAKGVREDVARTFVIVGLEKEGSINSLKDVVCKPRYQQFFLHEPNKGVYVPQVVQLKMNKFHCSFHMSGKEKADFIGCFPELDVVCNGTLRNPHGFYANKRLAESEVLVAHVWAHAARSESLNPTSIVDLGGNEVAHTRRGREYVHCDTPVMSARDAARYTVREIYSGSDPSKRCRLPFQACSHRADFGIAVHSTYDMRPTQIAHAMHRRGMTAFYGVLNIYPQMMSCKDGVHTHDGIVITADKGSLRYSFTNDTSLSYAHSKSVLESYLRSQYSISVEGENYNFRHVSIRGASLIFSVVKEPFLLSPGTSMATGGRADKYVIAVNEVFGDAVEVDRELFDRLVLMAASSKNLDDYNITSLFKYCKSLRARVSINSVVLSSGFQEDTRVLVMITIAAMAVAASYHKESARHFAKATTQINSRRSRSVVSNLLSLGPALVSSAVGVICDLTGFSSTCRAVSGLWLDKIKSLSSVSVKVATVKEFGNRFDHNDLGPMSVQVGRPDATEWFTGQFPERPAVLDSATMEAALVNPGNTWSGGGDLPDRVYTSYGVSRDYPSDLVLRRVTTTGYYDLPHLRSEPGSRAYVDESLRALWSMLHLPGHSGSVPRTLPNGDRVFEFVEGLDGLTNNADNISHRFVVVRGVGSKFVYCEIPRFYTSKCQSFILMFEEDITDHVRSDVSGIPVEELPNPIYSIVRSVASEYIACTSQRGEVHPEGTSIAYRSGKVQGFGPVKGRFAHSFDSVAYETVDFGGLESSDVGADGYASDDSELRGLPSISLPLPPLLPAVWNGSTAGVPDAFRDSVLPPRSGSGSARFDGPVLPAAEVRADQSGEVSVRSSPAQSTASSSGLGEFRKTVGRGDPGPSWASAGSDAEIAPGSAAMGELLEWSRLTQEAALSMGKRHAAFAVQALDGTLSERQWLGIQAGVEGGVVLCHVREGQMVEYYSGVEVKHMAYTDGDSIVVRSEAIDAGGVWVTYEDLRIFTCRAIDTRVRRCMFDLYSCNVTLVRGPAGCGKTTKIVKGMTNSDFGVCETRAAARDTVARLRKTKPELGERFMTVDSFFINCRDVPEVDVLYVDEALRLHAGKLWALVKLIRPNMVICFGDDKQIPALSFMPGFDFQYHVFPWTATKLIRETWRLPVDITTLLVESGYYDYTFRTHNPVVNAIRPTKHYVPGVFKDKDADVFVLTYTQSAKDDLLREGVSPVLTIGESQGKDLDHVWLYRDRPLAVQLYYDRHQTLTAITRVKKSFTFVTCCHDDDSAVTSDLLRLLSNDSVVSRFPEYQLPAGPVTKT